LVFRSLASNLGTLVPTNKVIEMSSTLIKKYNIAAPRYTSYPTVPYWEEDKFDVEVYKADVKRAILKGNKGDGMGIYIHLPYCESLCTFCGCNKRITKNHKVEDPYISTVVKEWGMYAGLVEERPKINEIHLGGGTPTFFAPEKLGELIAGLKAHGDILEDADLGFEAHPNNTREEHLKVLFAHGFNRLSLGVQDFDPAVQKAINRIQPFESVKRVVDQAREIGYNSVNFDLVYGLPKQHMPVMIDTITKVLKLMPDRIAFYSYAHVPWVSPAQRGYSEADLPKADDKRALYEKGRDMFLEAGYVEIGMDHFALPTDALSVAMDEGKLHRNFMGYTAKHTSLLVGLGVSAIGDSWNSFAQNEKVVEDYKDRVNADEFPIFRGHILSEEDLLVRKAILDLMCTYNLDQASIDSFMNSDELKERLKEPMADDLLEISDEGISVKESGKPFIRNICLAFDKRYWRKKPESKIFSSSI
jgi:oxygen-independent coproporphyrinogen-3 oxidase